MRTFVTGGTGFLGSNTLPYLLEKGKDITVLVRNPDRLNPELREKCRVISGDVTKPNLGIVERLPQFDEMYHLAALVFFNGKRAEELQAVNVDGVCNALDFALEHGVKHFYHISTSYVCGNAKGVWYESDLDKGQRPKNNYEKTKLEGEVLVHDFCRSHGMKATIFRPSVIVGNSRTAEIPVLQTIYQFVAAVEVAKIEVETKLHLPPMKNLTLPGKAHGYLNLVPVDYVARAIAEIDQPGVYHLVNPKSFTFGQLGMSIGSRLGLTITFRALPQRLLVFASHLKGIKPPPAMNRVSEFAPYLYGEPTFDATNTLRELAGKVECPILGETFLSNLVDVTRSHLDRLMKKEA